MTGRTGPAAPGGARLGDGDRGGGALVGWLRPDLAVSGGAPGSLEAALAQGAALVGSACVGWLWLVTGLTVLEAVGVRHPRAPGLPDGSAAAGAGRLRRRLVAGGPCPPSRRPG